MQPPRQPRIDAHRIRLSPKERRDLEALTSRGVVNARVLKRARILLLLDRGWAPVDIPEAVGVGEATVRRVKARYEAEGLELALYDRPRPGPARLLSDRQNAQIIALVCSDPPEGRARWTIELIVEEAIEQGIVESVGRETIRVLLRDHDLRPWREKNVVRSSARRRVH